MKKNGKKNTYMSSAEFTKLINGLCEELTIWESEGWDGSILELLDEQIDNKDFYLTRINPYDLIREFHRCNFDNYVCTKDEDSNEILFTNRFKILMGISECIAFCTQKEPKFKYGDIILREADHSFFYVMDFKNGTYFLDDWEGESSVIDQEDCESSHRKIGVAVNGKGKLIQ